MALVLVLAHLVTCVPSSVSRAWKRSSIGFVLSKRHLPVGPRLRKLNGLQFRAVNIISTRAAPGNAGSDEEDRVGDSAGSNVAPEPKTRSEVLCRVLGRRRCGHTSPVPGALGVLYEVWGRSSVSEKTRPKTLDE